MMWKYIKALFFSSVIFTFCLCSHKKQNPFTYHPLSFYYKILAFEKDTFVYQKNKIALLSLSFSTQVDSIFWKSDGNLNENYYLEIDSNSTSNFLQKMVSLSSLNDSLSMLLKVDDFKHQLDHIVDNLNIFSKKDTVTKINFKLKKILSKSEFLDLKISNSLTEKLMIENYIFQHINSKISKDELGFYWVEKPLENINRKIEQGDEITIAYKGSFLNEQPLDKNFTTFNYLYGTPYQLIKGLNFVIKKLKKGQNAKIIVPSHLAFEKKGSSNNLILPYTPLLYEIKIIDVKKIKTNK